MREKTDQNNDREKQLLNSFQRYFSAINTCNVSCVRSDDIVSVASIVMFVAPIW